MLKLDNKSLSYDRAFTHEGIQYPANWLRLSSLEERNALGIVEVADDPYYDQRFYWGPNNPKDLDELKQYWISTAKAGAASLLLQSDWYVVRRSDTGDEIPAEVITSRAEIREYCDSREVTIASFETVEELAAYVTASGFYDWESLHEPQPEPEPAPELEPEPEPEPTPDPDEILFPDGQATGSSIITDQSTGGVIITDQSTGSGITLI